VSDSTPPPPEASISPALIALGVMVILAIIGLGADLLLDRRTARHTSELVDDSLESIALADDLRYQAYRLVGGDQAPATLASIAKQIDADAIAYTPVAKGTDEFGEWVHLQGLLAHLQHDAMASDTQAMLREVEASIARLVVLNQRSARDYATEIRSEHSDGLWLDVIVGFITIGFAILIGATLVRGLRRRRRLYDLYITALAERNRDLAAFAAETAHDMRGPLSPIRGYADILTLEASPKVRDVALRIRKGVDRLNGIIDDLLGLSTSGKAKAGVTQIDSVVREVIAEQASTLGNGHIATSVKDATVACSSGLLAQVLRNVLSNAVKYRASERPLRVKLEGRRVGDIVELAISDNGRGMTPETVAHAFERDYRGTEDVPGHGFGLSIVKRALDSIGGSCEIESRLGVGTTVTIKLPIH
jgi:signal transduction histidine kinase